MSRLYKVLSRKELIQEIINGVRYELDLTELIDNSIYYSGCWEPATTKAISSLVKRGMVAFDVGANVGYFTILLSRLVGEEGRVFAFEPTSRALHRLQRNIEFNKCHNITIERKAISNIDNTQRILIHSSYKIDPTSKQEEITEEVGFATLDAYSRLHNIAKLDFIKIDTDGFEYKVVEGGARTLKEFKPIVVVEFGKHTLARNGDSLEALCGLLRELGYDFYNENSLTQYRSVTELVSSVPTNSTINVVCLSRESSKRKSGREPKLPVRMIRC